MATPSIEPLALRPREAARALGISPRTLWTWTREGRVPHVKIGRAVLYPAAELQAWLSAQTQTETEGRATAQPVAELAKGGQS